MRMLESGRISVVELHEAAVSTIERLNSTINAVVIPLFDRPAVGVPMLLKDAGQELAGTPHWVGVAALREAASRSTTTTELARRFERIGFSIIGKSACPQLSSGVTTEPAGFAPTRNPWKNDCSVGGSSGGSAAAVASGMAAVAHGSDATGSLRCPAALCGVATLNPSARRIRGVAPAGQPSSDVWRDFVIARHAEDLSYVFRALVFGAATERHKKRDKIQPLRVGLLDHDPELGIAVHPTCAAAVHVAATMLESLGHVVEYAWPSPLDRLWSAIAKPVAVITDATRPPMIRWVSDRLGRSVMRGELDDAIFDAAERALTRSGEAVAVANTTLQAAVEPIHDWWNDFDLLVTPTTFQPAWPLGGKPGPLEMGQPALSLPLHESDDGLPVGVQLVGRRGADELLLHLAEQLQEMNDWTLRRPPIG